MRSNMALAVTFTTGHEYLLEDGETIVSKTDLRGNITYVNADFVRISGYSEEELIGQPQNIVRHPDMPPEAFKDFWTTIRAGKAWTGLVKNRCKNGDHYWVEANAAPLIENGRVVGYTSVRVKPTREQVMEAESAYASIRKGEQRYIVHEGAVVKASARERIFGNAADTKRTSFCLPSSWLLSRACLPCLPTRCKGISEPCCPWSE